MDKQQAIGRRGNGTSLTTSLVNDPANGHGSRAALGVEAIVLDIDDTLYLERDYVRSGFEAVGRWIQGEHGIADFSERAWAAFESGSRNTIFDQVLSEIGARTDDAFITELVARYRTHPPSIVLAADAEAGLDRWHGHVSLAAITDGPLSSQQAKARALGLERWTPHVIFTAGLGPGKGKPDPAAFELVQDKLGVNGKACVYVADNPAKDFVGPKALGWRTVRVRRRLGLHADVESGTDVDFEIMTLEQLDAVLAP
jgi:putative hydrolase of the HAD superfamily